MHLNAATGIEKKKSHIVDLKTGFTSSISVEI